MGAYIVTRVGHEGTGKDRGHHLRESEGEELHAGFDSGGRIDSLKIEGNVVEFLGAILALLTSTSCPKQSVIIVSTCRLTT